MYVQSVERHISASLKEQGKNKINAGILGPHDDCMGIKTYKHTFVLKGHSMVYDMYIFALYVYVLHKYFKFTCKCGQTYIILTCS